MKKPRLVYAIIFAILFFAELLIGIFVHDNFIRPYVGDVLVTILLCCLWRIICPNGISALPIYVFVFATLVEVLQCFDIVILLGVEEYGLLSTVIGTTFSVVDLICYGVGCVAFWFAEKAFRIWKHRHLKDS